MNKPLDGIKVVDFTHVISGPYCTQILGDMGAEIIKIERPDVGEFYRAEGIKNEQGISIVYPNYNRNKKGITLNIKKDKAKELVKELVAKSDVFVENQRPGLLDEMGLGYEDLKKINPKLIYVSISGFGKTGPYANKGAFDMTIAAISGLMAVNGVEGIPPLKTGVAFSDFLSGIYGALGTVLALRQRDVTQEGQNVDISMLESIVSVLDAFIPQVELLDDEPSRMGNRRVGFAPVNVFPVIDGYVYVAPSFQKHWEILCKLMDREDLLKDEKIKLPSCRKEKEPYLEKIVEDWTKDKTSKQLVNLLEAAGVPCAPVLKISEVVKDKQIIERNVIQHVEYPGIGQYPHVASPIRMSKVNAEISKAPDLGEHNEHIYRDFLGYTEEEYIELIKQKII